MIRIISIIVAILFSEHTIAQNSSYKSFSRGIGVIQKAFQKIGGRQNIGAIQNITIKYQELNSSRGQGVSPNSEVTMNEGGESVLIFDAQNEKSFHQRSLPRRGRLFDPIIVMKEKGSFFYWPETNELQSNLDTDVIKGSFNFRFVYPKKLLPHILLQNALQNRSSIRWEDERIINGNVNDVVSFIHSDGSLITVFIDRETSIPSGTEELLYDFNKGDATGLVLYDDYKNYNGVLIPDQFSFFLSQELVREMKVNSIQINEQIDSEIFELPSGIKEGDYQPSFRPQRVANGVFFMPLYSGTGIPYNSMFVVFEDHVMVFDAPLGDFLSHIYMQIIGQVAPGKPIRYVVPTHHHVDHVGGIRRFMAQSSTIVTTPGNEAYFRNLSKVGSLLSPIPLTIDSENLTFDIVKRKKSYADETQVVELYDVGPNPHANEILVAYLPKSKVLYVTDLFWVPLVDNHYPPARETLTDFVKKIKRLKLDVETIVPGHGRLGTIDDLTEALKQ